MKKGYQYIDNHGSFRMKHPEQYSYLYFPLANEAGIKSALTPLLGGDAKVGQNTFLLQPVSAEELHNNRSTRNFWIKIGTDAVSLTGADAISEAEKFINPQESATMLEAGFMWHKITRRLPKYQLRSEILSFAPCTDDAVELMQITLYNEGNEVVEVSPTAAIPIYGRSADNLRDHRHVTSLLHRIYTLPQGVAVNPTLTFDERGHCKNRVQYYVMGAESDGTLPIGFYPIVEDYIGEGGSFTTPRAIREACSPVSAGQETDGYEAMGGIVFAAKKIAAGASVSWIVMLGVHESDHVEADSVWMDSLKKIYEKYSTVQRVNTIYEDTVRYWHNRVNVAYRTGETDYDNFLAWVSFQPILRRIYGCSFLPHHDYGKGGRGWRDLWQDCLALLMMNPKGVRDMLLNYYCGVRADGTNATIIGAKEGEFLADRNHIVRVWMDHGMWPLLTTDFYIQQTGDIAILTEQATYFKDAQIMRGQAKDALWKEEQGCIQRDSVGKPIQGSILEHILIQHLTVFYEVGEHNHMRLRGADWNDALDMAGERGESVAFSAAYAGNFMTLAELVNAMQERLGIVETELLPQLELLLRQEEAVYDDVATKQAILDEYCQSCSHVVSADRQRVSLSYLSHQLRQMGKWLMQHIRATEWIDDGERGWFNSYYDNHARAVEGHFADGVRMMLTGQVFTIMSGTADEQQISRICMATDAYLYDEHVGGYRLNTDFHERKDDLGRMFGFAYGHKENGAVFSHMATMYANALYCRGFVKEGYRALQALYHQAADVEVSRIYPGLPEYFNDRGRGMYHYLTGAASWYMITVITRMYGVRGRWGDLCLAPALLAEQFAQTKELLVALEYAGVPICVTYCNPQQLEYGEYQIGEVSIDGQPIACAKGTQVLIAREKIAGLDAGCTHDLRVVLCQ